MDASTVGETTVTVAVYTSREEEPAVLEALYEHGADLDFKPFYEKSNTIERQAQREFCEEVIQSQQSHLTAFAHNENEEGNTNTRQIEAVHSAIHVDTLLTSDDNPLIIIDGNEQQATPFLRALSGLRSERPTVAHCLQSEYYYPTALLADLTANYLAHSIESGTYDHLNPVLPAPRAKKAHAAKWGQSFSSMYQNNIVYEAPEIQRMRGETVRERICCWYKGAITMDGGEERPLSDSLNPVTQALRRDGFDTLADILADI